MLQRIELLARLAEIPLDRRDHVPRAGQAAFISRRLEDPDRVSGFGPRQVERSLQLAQQPPVGERGVGDELGVAEVFGQGAELRRESGRLFGESALPERLRQVRDEREPSRIGRVEQCLGAPEEVATARMSWRASAREPAAASRSDARRASLRAWSSSGPSSCRYRNACSRW
jgi:hypothetical protein